MEVWVLTVMVLTGGLSVEANVGSLVYQKQEDCLYSLEQNKSDLMNKNPNSKIWAECTKHIVIKKEKIRLDHEKRN